MAKPARSFDASQFTFERLGKVYAERHSRLIFFVGSGPSTTERVLSWVGLRDRIATAARSKLSHLPTSARIEKEKQITRTLSNKSLWPQFDQLQKLAGFATFREAVISALEGSKTSAIPSTYSTLWSLRTKGIFTLNLDAFPMRAFPSSNSRGLSSILPHEFGRKAHLLEDPAQPILVHLHGTLDDVESWVLTADKLKATLDNPEYLNLVNTAFTAYTVVFVGISADDVAAGGILSRLIQKSINPGHHYWITSRDDKKSDEWAEKNSVLVIRYSATGGHSEGLDALFTSLKTYLPEEQRLPPVINSTISTTQTIASPEDLEKLDRNEIRKKLNSYVAGMKVRGGGVVDSSEYDNFLKNYEACIHRSWFVSERPNQNSFFDYKILERIGSGLFSTVFKASTPDGQLRAIKVLRQEILSDEAMLQCFRRGEQSLRILNENSVPGVVRMHEAFELPAAIIMDYIEGANLEQIREANLLDPWVDGLYIAESVAHIVRAGHRLPQEVLHRDLRPANVMLKDAYTSAHRNVVVLDFDLSWHLGATGKSLSPRSLQALTYLSPEQQDARGTRGTRSSAVDSFGLAMTLYFLLTGKGPEIGEHQRDNWEKVVFDRLPSCRPWSSARRRTARLIAAATRREQPLRPDMGEMEFELSRIRKSIRSKVETRSASMWAEQIMSEAVGEKYEWDADSISAKLATPSGAVCELAADEANQAVEARISYNMLGTEKRRNVDRYLPTAFDKAGKHLRDGGWKVVTADKEQYSARMVVRLGVDSIIQSSDGRLSKAISRAASEFQFE